MTLIFGLLSSARWLLATALCASLVGGFGGAAQVALVHRALEQSPEQLPTIAWQFAALSVLVLMARWTSQLQFVRAGQSLLARLRRELSHGVARAEYRHLEELGASRLLGMLTDDVSTIAHWIVSLPRFIVNGAIVLGCLGYLAFLSWPVFLLAASVVGLGSLAYHLAHSRALHQLRASRAKEDELFQHFRALFDGAKELRLHEPRRRQFLSELVDESIQAARSLQTEGMSINVRSACLAHFLFFMLIGAVVFGLSPLLHLARDALSGYALVLLYMMLPLEVMLSAIPGMGRAQVALERIHQGLQELHERVLPESISPVVSATEAAQGFQSLTFRRTSWCYREGQGDGFSLGPLDLELARGEVVFLIGSNGGGKSTLVKLLVGLYAPQAGEVLLNGRRVPCTTDDAYRGLFSAVFSDFFLFDRLLGLGSGDPQGNGDLDSRARHLLERLRLSHLVRVAEGKLSTTSLSTGQRKRLALMVARLEDRPIYVFDEWAADQDPQYKDIFYRHILPELKAAGKAVLAITHDDRYFDLADRRIELNFGTLVERRLHPSPATADVLGK